MQNRRLNSFNNLGLDQNLNEVDQINGRGLAVKNTYFMQMMDL